MAKLNNSTVPALKDLVYRFSKYTSKPGKPFDTGFMVGSGEN